MLLAFGNQSLFFSPAHFLVHFDTFAPFGSESILISLMENENFSVVFRLSFISQIKISVAQG